MIYYMYTLSLILLMGDRVNGDRHASLTALSTERAVFQTDHGDIHLAFYPNAAPNTVALILKLIKLGCYNTNHFFRVDAGFVAQVADVANGREVPLDSVQRSYAEKTVPLEVHKDLKHDKIGILSLARHDDPNSGGSSFSILLGPAPHLDLSYAVFGELTSGFEVLESLQKVETTRDGIFVMPKSRITIHSTYVYDATDDSSSAPAAASCRGTLNSVVSQLHAVREQLSNH